MDKPTRFITLLLLLFMGSTSHAQIPEKGDHTTLLSVLGFATVTVIILFCISQRQNQKLRQAIASRLEKAPTEVLARVEYIADDLLYLGSESEIVKTSVQIIERTPDYRFECLCKTKSGNWFVLTFDFCPQLAQVLSSTVHPIRVSDAKAHLSKHTVEYKRHFGEVVTA